MKAPVFIMLFLFWIISFLQCCVEVGRGREGGGWCMIVSGEEWCVTPALQPTSPLQCNHHNKFWIIGDTGQYWLFHLSQRWRMSSVLVSLPGYCEIDDWPALQHRSISPLLYTILHSSYWGCCLVLVLTTPEIKIKTLRKNNSLYLHLISLVSNT